MRRYLAVLAAVAASIVSVSAQCTTLPDLDHYNQYQVQVCPLAQPTPVTLTNITQPTFTSDDNGINTQQIFLPFPIQVYGVDWDRIWMNTNGALFFGSVGSTAGSEVLPLSYGDVESLPVIAAAWTDLVMVSTGTNPSRIVYSTQGTVGDRQMVVRYESMRYWVVRDNPNVLASFDIVFYENPSREGDIEIRYYRWDMATQPNTQWPALTVGMQSFDDGTSYFAWRETQSRNSTHGDFAQQFLGKQMSLRYIGEDSRDVACGSMGYNFTSMRGTDLSYTDPQNGNQYFVNLCGEVQDPICANNAATEKAMICMVPSAAGAAPVDLGVFGPGAIKYELHQGSQGINMILQNGNFCPMIESQIFTRVMHYCAPGQPPMMVAVAQAPAPCVFYMTIISDAACNGATRDNSTRYRSSTLPGCVSTTEGSTAGYTGNLCPRPGHSLEPPVLADTTTILQNTLSGLHQVQLPFAFPFYGQSYTSVNISVKGALLFGSAEYISHFAEQFPNLGMNGAVQSAWPMIVGFGGNLLAQSRPGIPYPEIKYTFETNSLGKRQLVVRYWDMKFANTMGLADSPIDFDIVITEDGGIEIKYWVVSPSNNRFSIGLRGPTDLYTAQTDFAQLTAGSAFVLQGTTLSFVPGRGAPSSTGQAGDGSTGGESESSSSSSLSGGAIAGIVIGSVVGALVLAAFVIIMCTQCCSKGSKGGKSKDTELTSV